MTSTLTLCGRRGTYGTGLAPVARLGRSGREWRRGCWRGRRGTLRHPPSFHVADLSSHNLSSHNVPPHNLSSNNLLTHNLSSHILSSHNLLTHTLFTHNLLTHNLSSHICVAGVARMALGWLRWCAWAGVAPSFHVAGVVLGDIDLHFVWQAWHVWHWAGSGGALGPEWPGMAPRLLAWQALHFETSTFVSRGRRGIW